MWSKQLHIFYCSSIGMGLALAKLLPSLATSEKSILIHDAFLILNVIFQLRLKKKDFSL